MYMYTCIYIYIYIHTCVYTYIYTHTHVCCRVASDVWHLATVTLGRDGHPSAMYIYIYIYACA